MVGEHKGDFWAADFSSGVNFPKERKLSRYFEIEVISNFIDSDIVICLQNDPSKLVLWFHLSTNAA